VLPVPALQPRLRILGAAVLLFLALFSELIARLSGARRRAFWPRLLQRLDSLSRGRLALAGRWSDLKSALADSVRGRDGNLTISVLYFLGGWLWASVEVFIILRLLGAPVSAATAYSIAVLMILVEGVFFFVPARAGILEGGLYAIFSVLGLDPVKGFALALVRRLRDLAWACLGLIVLGLADRLPGGRKQPAPVEGLPEGPPI
jgi:hypothetical protein